MLKIIFVLFDLWIYQCIGILHYKLRHTGSEYGKTRVNIPSTPSFLLFLLSKIFRGRLHWLLGTSPGGIWHYGKWNDKNYRKWIIEEYKEIWIWPFIEGRIVYKNLRIRVLDRYHIVLRTQQKKYLRESMFSQLKDDVKNRLAGFKIIGADYFDRRYRVYLQLPCKTIDFLGPWLDPSEEQKPYGHWGEICKFQTDASKKLNAILDLPHSKNMKKTREVVVEVRKGIFYDINGWSFQQTKWEIWKEEFIKFFKEINDRFYGIPVA